MLGLFISNEHKRHKTYYSKELAKQAVERLDRSKMRLSVIVGLLNDDETTNRVDLALEMCDLIRYIESHTKANDFKLGLVLSDCDVLRANNKLGQNKYSIETTNEGW